MWHVYFDFFCCIFFINKEYETLYVRYFPGPCVMQLVLIQILIVYVLKHYVDCRYSYFQIKKNLLIPEYLKIIRPTRAYLKVLVENFKLEPSPSSLLGKTRPHLSK